MREYDRDRERSPRDEEDRPSPKGSGERRGRRKKKKHPVLGHILRAFASLICLGIIAGCVVACYLTVYAFDMLEDEQYILDLDAKKLEYTTFMYAQDPVTQEWVELQRLSSENGNRIWVDFEQQ